MTISIRLALVILLIFTSVLMTSCMLFSGDSTVVPKLRPAPEEVPVVSLVDSKTHEIIQQGVLVNSEWLIDGQEVRKEISKPIAWPSPVIPEGSGTAKIMINTPSAPAILQIRQFDRVEPDGSLPDKAISTTKWQHPRLFSHPPDQSNATLRSDSSENLQGWEFDVEFPSSYDTVFVTVWATWKGFYNANWNMTIKK